MTAMGMAGRGGSHAPQPNTVAAASGQPRLSLPPSATASCEDPLVGSAWQQWERHPGPGFRAISATHPPAPIDIGENRTGRLKAAYGPPTGSQRS